VAFAAILCLRLLARRGSTAFRSSNVGKVFNLIERADTIYGKLAVTEKWRGSEPLIRMA